jgi:hypothetical protein
MNRKGHGTALFMLLFSLTYQFKDYSKFVHFLTMFKCQLAFNSIIIAKLEL